MDYWKAHPLPNDQREIASFYRNLVNLMSLSTNLANSERYREEHTLYDIENKLASLMDGRDRGYTSIEEKLHLVDLEAQKSKILLDPEETWRLRSREIWLHAGDGNTKFLHKYANKRKSSNTIWQMPIE